MSQNQQSSRLPISIPQLPPKPAEQKARSGAHRSTKVAGKLKVLPEQPEEQVQPAAPGLQSRGIDAEAGDSDEGDVEEEEEQTGHVEEDAEVYNQIALIPDGTARRDALRLTKKKAKSLPRVTAFATASSYRMPDLLKFFHARKGSHRTAPRMIEDVIYTPYAYEAGLSPDATRTAVPTADLLGSADLISDSAPRKRSKFYTTTEESEIFIFPYGTVVVWGMTEAQEKRFLSTLRRFEVEKLEPENVEMEDLNFYYANYSRIYNDVITLRKGSGYMTKLSLSHALAQSVKISLFEELITSTIEETKDIPEIISETGKIGMPHKEIMQQIGQLFLLRTNINSVGSVLDSPDRKSVV